MSHGAEPRLLAPLLFEVRASTLLWQLQAETLSAVPLAWLADLRRQGFDMLYLLGVWCTGAAGLAHSQAQLGADAPAAVSSPFAISAYHVSPSLGGDASLMLLRAAANSVGLRVLVDFVPNHLARDHAWTLSKPWLFQQGSEAEAARHPERYYQPLAGGPWLAHGRDMHSAGGWRDTAQLNLRHPHTRGLMRGLLVWLASSGLADGVRCDMAMLALTGVQQRTWGDAPLGLPGPFPIPPLAQDLAEVGCLPPLEGGGAARARQELGAAQARQALSAAHPEPSAAHAARESALQRSESASSATTASSTGSLAACGGGGVGGGGGIGNAAAVVGTSAGVGAPPVLPAPLSLAGITLATATPTPGVAGAAIPLDSDRMLRPVEAEWWPDAIACARAAAPGFLLIAEVYWDLEAMLLDAGFDFCYDKTLYDRLFLGSAESLLSHLRAPVAWQQRLVRFTENHDEQRAAAVHRGGARGAAAAAVVAYTSPG